MLSEEVLHLVLTDWRIFFYEKAKSSMYRLRKSTANFLYRSRLPTWLHTELLTASAVPGSYSRPLHGSRFRAHRRSPEQSPSTARNIIAAITSIPRFHPLVFAGATGCERVSFDNKAREYLRTSRTYGAHPEFECDQQTNVAIIQRGESAGGKRNLRKQSEKKSLICTRSDTCVEPHAKSGQIGFVKRGVPEAVVRVSSGETCVCFREISRTVADSRRNSRDVTLLYIRTCR